MINYSSFPARLRRFSALRDLCGELYRYIFFGKFIVIFVLNTAKGKERFQSAFCCIDRRIEFFVFVKPLLFSLLCRIRIEKFAFTCNGKSVLNFAPFSNNPSAEFQFRQNEPPDDNSTKQSTTDNKRKAVRQAEQISRFARTYIRRARVRMRR